MAFSCAGTFFLVWTVATQASNGIAIGAALMVMVYAGGHISGAAYNPCVAFAQFLNGSLGDGKKGDIKKFGLYVLVEILAGILAALFGYMVLPEANGIACPSPMRAPDSYFNEIEMFLNEFFWTVALSYVVLTTACTEQTKDNSYYGFCIGMTITCATISGSISGGSYNPAVGTGLLIAAAINSPDNNTCSDDNFQYIWIFLIAPMLGGLCGWGLHRLTNGKHYGDGRFDKFAPFIQEFIGTFYLCFTIGLSTLGGNLAAFQIGTILAIMVYCGGHVSGGQYNPAVSLGVFIRGGQSLVKMFVFWGMQFLGGFVGALMAYLITRYGSGDGQDFLDNGGTALIPASPRLANDDVDEFGALIAEFVVTFALVFVVLSTATTEKIAANSFFGIAIGWTVLAGAWSVGRFTGGAFNPAVWLGTNLMYAFHEDGDPLADIWLYLIAHLLGGVAAGFFYRFVGGVTDKISTKVSPQN